MFLFISYGWIIFITAGAAWCDIQTRTIANSLILIGLIGLLFWQLLHGTINWLSLIISTALGLLLWSGKLFGGGDSKLLILVSTALRGLYFFRHAVIPLFLINAKTTLAPHLKSHIHRKTALKFHLHHAFEQIVFQT